MDRVDDVRGWGPPSARSNPAGGNRRRSGVWDPRVNNKRKEGKFRKWKMEFDCRYTRFKTTFLNTLEAEFENTPIGGNVLNLFLYIFFI